MILHKKAFIVLCAGVVLSAAAVAADASLDTEKLQRKIDELSAAGGGTLRIPAGEYVVASLRLKSGVTLHLERGAYLYGSTNETDYVRYVNEGDTAYSVVYAEGAENVAVEGEGVIDGRGKLHNRHRDHKLYPGWDNLYFQDCKNVRVEDVTLRNASSWCCFFRGCDGVVARRVKIFNHCNWSNDGIDIESSNVLVEDCDIDSEDDSLVMKAREPGRVVENVVVRNCRLSCNAEHIKIGTESLGTFRNILVEDCDVACRTPKCATGGYLKVPGVKSMQTALSAISLFVVDGGSMEGVTVRRIGVGEGIITPICIRLAGRKQRQLPGKSFLRDIRIEDVKMSAPSASFVACSITGLPELRPQNITLRNVDLLFKGGGRAADAEQKIAEEYPARYPAPYYVFKSTFPAYAFYLRHADGIRFENVNFKTVDPDEARPPIVADDATYEEVGGDASRNPELAARLARRKAAMDKLVTDESKVAPYTLEDPHVFANGKRVASPEQWPARRAEILDIFAREMYGQPPPAPETVAVELREEGPTLAGLAIRRQYRMWFKADKTGPFIDWLLVLPNKIKAKDPKKGDGGILYETVGKSPVVLFLNYRGNHELLDDQEVFGPEGAWLRNNSEMHCVGHRPNVEKTRGSMRRTGSSSQFPVETIVARGYATLSACYGQVSPDVEVLKGDDEALAYTGVFDLWPKRDPAKDDNTTALGAWAWALSRGLDLAEKIPEIDAKKSVVTGCSRLGKAALLAAARDERFAVCVPNQTGGGGAPLSKRAFGESVATEMEMFPHWYCRAYAKYAGNEKAMPFDQHLLLAAVAPRALLVEGYNSNWFDPKGEYLACKAASPVWEFLGAGKLPGGEFPSEYSVSAIGTRLGYVRRGGRHGLAGDDWRWMLDFADGVWAQRPPAPPCVGIDFQKLIDDAALAGGGVVTVPPGRHVTKGLILKSNVELHLEKGATLEGSANAADYPKVILPYSEGDWMAVVMAVGAENVAVTGEGEIFGNGKAWPLPESYGGNQEGRRPRGLAFLGCRNIRLEDFTLRDAACWGIVLKCCDGMTAKRVKISSHANANNDGFDIEAKNVVIEDCDVDSGDDAYCIKSNDPGFSVENVAVRRCVGRSFCNSFKLGTASHGVMRNVLFENCRSELPKRWFMDTRFGRNRKMYAYEERSKRNFLLRDKENGSGISGIAVECVDGGIVEHIVFRDMEIAGVGVPIFIRGGMRTGRGCGTPPNDKYVIRDILIENVSGQWSSATANSISGVEGCRVKNVQLRNVHLHGPGAGECAAEKTRPVPERPGSYPEANLFRCMLPAYGLWARHVDDLSLQDVSFTIDEGTVDSREAVVTDDVTEFHYMD